MFQIAIVFQLQKMMIILIQAAFNSSLTQKQSKLSVIIKT